MIRDKRMQMLVAAHLEPITPFLFKVSVASVLMRECHGQTDTRRSLGGSLQVRDIYESAGVSSIVVIGGCGDYFDVADIVISLEAYLPSEVTERAKAIAAEVPSSLGDLEALKMTRPRCVRPPGPKSPTCTPWRAPDSMCMLVGDSRFAPRRLIVFVPWTPTTDPLHRRLHSNLSVGHESRTTAQCPR